MRHRYHINLSWPDENECWIAEMRDLIYCCAYGPTSEAALAEVETAICTWLAVQSESRTRNELSDFSPAPKLTSEDEYHGNSTDWVEAFVFFCRKNGAKPFRTCIALDRMEA